LHILSTIMVICLSVKMGFEAAAEDDEEGAAGPPAEEEEEADMAAEAARITEASSIIGSGEDGGEDLSPPAVSVGICFLLRSLLSSSRRLLAISAGERGVSLKAEEVDAAAAAEAEGDGEEDIMGEREFCCRLSIASYLSRPCSLRGTHLLLLEGGGLRLLQAAGTTATGDWLLEGPGETTLGGSKGCSDRAAWYGRFRVTHAISRRDCGDLPSGRGSNRGRRGPRGGRRRPFRL